MQCVQLVGTPILPYLIVPYWRFQQVTHPVLDVWVGHRHFSRVWYLHPPLLSLFMLGGGTLRVPGRDPCPRTGLPLGCRRSHASLACIDLGTSPTYQGIYFTGSCHCGYRGADVGHSPLPSSTSWCPALVGGQLLRPTGGLPLPPGGPLHVGFSSHETWTDLLVGWMAGGQWQLHCISLLPAGSTPHLCNWPISEDKMSWIAFSLSEGPHGGGLGDLLRRYTSWYRSQISLQEVQ